MDPPLEHPVLPSPPFPTNSVQLFDMKSAANCQKLLNILHVRVELSQQKRKGGRGRFYTSNQLAKCAG